MVGAIRPVQRTVEGYFTLIFYTNEFVQAAYFQEVSSVMLCHKETSGGRHMNFTTGIMMENGAETVLGMG